MAFPKSKQAILDGGKKKKSVVRQRWKHMEKVTQEGGENKGNK